MNLVKCPPTLPFETEYVQWGCEMDFSMMCVYRAAGRAEVSLDLDSVQQVAA